VYQIFRLNFFAHVPQNIKIIGVPPTVFNNVFETKFLLKYDSTNIHVDCGDFAFGGSATITVVVIVFGLIVALAIAISSAVSFWCRTVEAETSVKSR